jgi:hypothetical protein
VRFREAVAEATMEGELIPPVAAISLKAVNDAGEDLFRDKTGLPTGAGGFVIERVVFAARPVSVTAGPAPEVPTVRVVDAPVSMPVAPTVSPPQLSPPRNEAEVLIERFSRAASAASPEAADAG